MLFGANMISEKSEFVCWVKVCSWSLFLCPLQTNYLPSFYELPCLEQKITKVDWESTMYSAVKCPWIFIFILFRLIFSVFIALLFTQLTSNIGKFCLWFGCPIANCGPLLRKQPHSFDVNHYVLSMFDLKVTGSLITRLGP